jgi:hypothetical protein
MQYGPMGKAKDVNQKPVQRVPTVRSTKTHEDWRTRLQRGLQRETSPQPCWWSR